MATFTSLREAARYAGVSYQAVRNWTSDYDIGRLIDNRWNIDKEKLDAVIAMRDHIAEIKSEFRKSA